MTRKKKTRSAAYHDRQREQGRRLVQIYVDADLHERIVVIGRKQGVPLQHVYSEAAADYADRKATAPAAQTRTQEVQEHVTLNGT